MNRLFTILSLSAACSTSMAQFPSISSTNQIPSIGDTISYMDANTFGFDEDGTGGAIDVMWNFSGLSTAGTFIDFFYVDPSTTPEAANFPSATVAQGNSITTDGYEYFETDANTIKRWGYTDPTNGSIYYDQAWNRYEFSIDPGTNWSTTYTGSMTPFGFGEDSVTIDNGNYYAEPDQFGLLMLPSLSGGDPEVFDSVVRVHVIESFQINLWIVGTPAMTINVSDDYYFWFDEETQEPILIYGTTTDDAGGSPQTVLRYQEVPGTGVMPVGVSEQDLIDVNVFPNPVQDQLNVVVSEGTGSYELINAIGEVVTTGTLQEGNNRVDVAGFSSGVYFVKVNSSKGIRAQKVIIE